MGGLVGVPVSYVVDVNFDKFQALVDGVGGVTINVPTEMHDTYSGAYFHPGVQHIERRTRRCAFSRDRHDFPSSDIIRTGNQGLLILAAIAQLQHDSRRTRAASSTSSACSTSTPSSRTSAITDLYRLGRVMYRIPADADPFGDDPDRRRRLPLARR